jgi:hypothetical protein
VVEAVGREAKDVVCEHGNIVLLAATARMVAVCVVWESCVDGGALLLVYG